MLNICKENAEIFVGEFLQYVGKILQRKRDERSINPSSGHRPSKRFTGKKERKDDGEMGRKDE